MKKKFLNSVLALSLALVVGFSFSTISNAEAQEPGHSTVTCKDGDPDWTGATNRARKCGVTQCPWGDVQWNATSGTCTIKNTGPSIEIAL